MKMRKKTSRSHKVTLTYLRLPENETIQPMDEGRKIEATSWTTLYADDPDVGITVCECRFAYVRRRVGV